MNPLGDLQEPSETVVIRVISWPFGPGYAVLPTAHSGFTTRTPRTPVNTLIYVNIRVNNDQKGQNPR